MIVKVKDVLRGRLEPVILPHQRDGGQAEVEGIREKGEGSGANGQAVLAARPVSDQYQEAVMCVIRDSMEELGLSEDDIGLNKEEREESAARLEKVVAKISFKDIVLRTKFLHQLENVKIFELIVLMETAEPAFETIAEVRRLPLDFKAAMLEAITTQEGRSSQLGESKRGD